jgi:hypothetical protein
MKTSHANLSLHRQQKGVATDELSHRYRLTYALSIRRATLLAQRNSLSGMKIDFCLQKNALRLQATVASKKKMITAPGGLNISNVCL